MSSVEAWEKFFETLEETKRRKLLSFIEFLEKNVEDFYFMLDKKLRDLVELAKVRNLQTLTLVKIGLGYEYWHNPS